MSPAAPLTRLIALLGRLPGVGRRSAERMAVKLARDEGTLIRDLIQALDDVDKNVTVCSRCGGMTIKEADPCSLCSDPKRDDQVLCVVEDPADIALLEKSGEFRGRYHALMGKISPMRGEGIQDLRVDSLLARVDRESIKEVILALNSDVESDATAMFLRHALEGKPVKVTRLAFGIPAGSEIAYSDAVTLSRALKGRQAF